MKSFEEFIKTYEEENWVTINGHHILIDKDSGDIKSGALKGTNIKDYKDNVKKLSKKD